MNQFLAIVEPIGTWLVPTKDQRRAGFQGDGLTPAERSQALATPGLTGLDVRIRPGTSDVVRDCVCAGLPYRLHSWVGRHDGTRATVDMPEARRQAKQISDQAQAIANLAGALPQSYGMNAERDWWSFNGAALDALDAFAEEWQRRTTIPLDYLGFAVPSWHYGRADFDHDGDVDTVIGAATRARFRRLLCMAYQDTESQIAATLARARAAWPGTPMGAYVSIGALRPDGSVIGHPDAVARIASSRASGIDELTHYVGLPASWRRMLLQGNERVRSLVARIPEIARACVA